MNPGVVNMNVVTNSKNFQKGIHIFYEKRFKVDKVEVAEYYYNHKLDSYFTTKRLSNLKIIKGYTPRHKLFHTEIIIFKNSLPFYTKQWIATIDGEDHLYEGYIK